jgi:hypothetical protein
MQRIDCIYFVATHFLLVFDHCSTQGYTSLAQKEIFKIFYGSYLTRDKFKAQNI